MNEKFELTKFSAGDTKEHEGITYKAVRQERYAKSGTKCARGARSTREANLAKALEGGCV